MLYYRVPERLNGKRVHINRKGQIFELVANELFTANECKRYHINPLALEPKELSKYRIYWLFGARFEKGTNDTTKKL